MVPVHKKATFESVVMLTKCSCIEQLLHCHAGNWCVWVTKQLMVATYLSRHKVGFQKLNAALQSMVANGLPDVECDGSYSYSSATPGCTAGTHLSINRTRNFAQCDCLTCMTERMSVLTGCGKTRIQKEYSRLHAVSVFNIMHGLQAQSGRKLPVEGSWMEGMTYCCQSLLLKLHTLHRVSVRKCDR